MITRCFFLLLFLPYLSLFSEDIPKPTTKKEKIPALPHVWVSGGLICLRAQENGLGFANQAQDISTTEDFVDSSTTQPHFEWDCGVKIEFGYQPREWLFLADWTNIQNTAHGKKTTDGTTGFFPTLSLSNTDLPSDYVTSATSLWKLKTHLVDFGTMVPWTPSKYFILKSRFGFRVASLDQKYNINYGGGVFNQGIDVINMRNNFFGGGPSIGITPNFIFLKGFSIFADISTSALIGNFFVQQTEKYLDQTLFHDTHRMTRVRWSLDAKAALSWQIEFLYKALVFSAQAGWEWHEFFKQNEMQQNSFGFFNDNKNLIMRGGFISLCLGF